MSTENEQQDLEQVEEASAPVKQEAQEASDGYSDSTEQSGDVAVHGSVDDQLKVTLTKQVFKPVPEKFKGGKYSPVPLMAFQYAKLEQRWKSWRPIQEDDANEETVKWFETYYPAQQGVMEKDLYSKMFADQAGWQQRPTHGDAALVPRIHDGSLSKITGDVELTGSKFVNALRRVRSNGATIQIPLVHSGFCIYIKPSRLIRRVALDALRQMTRVTLGRETNGLIFSARGALEQRDIFEFAMEHVIGANVEGYDLQKIRQFIKTPDLSIIAYACALAHHPDGYPHSIPCYNNPQQCRHVEEILLDLAACWWANLDKLTPWQREHITRRNNVKWNDIERYQGEGIFAGGTEYKIGDSTTFVTRIPTVDEYFDEAANWVDYIKGNIDKVLNNDTDENLRNIHLSQGLEATRMREYSPWVKKYSVIVSDDTTISAATPEDVALALEEDSPDSKIADGLEQKIKEFIEKITCAAVGYPQFKCPVCQSGMNVTDADFSKMKFESIVPMDPFKSFFRLMGQDDTSTPS